MGAQSFTDACGVCHAGGGSLEYDRDLNWYSAASAGGDAYILKIQGLGVSADYAKAPEAGYMSSTNKAEMDCLMCHLTDSNPGAAWLRTLGCGPDNQIGPSYDPTCAGVAGGHGPMGRTLNTDLDTGVAEYDMFNRNFALKQYLPKLAPSMGAGAKGTFDAAGKLTGVDWGVAGAVTLDGSRIAATPKSENCAVCHARVDDTMGLPGMMSMRTGYGNFDLLYRPDKPAAALAAGQDGQNDDLDTDNGPGAANDDFFQDFGCKTGMGKRAHKVNSEGDTVGTNGRYGMTPMVPSTMDMDPATSPNPGDVIAGKMPDIDVHNTAGMQCATCHYAIGSDNANGYVDIPSRTVHGLVYPAERVYGMDHQFAQSDAFPDTKSKNNLDNGVNCESCHIDQTHPNKGTAAIPTHVGFPASHLEKIGCATCHIPEVYAAPGRLKYRDWSAGFWHHTQKNVLDWNYDLMTGSHNTVPTIHRWLDKGSNISEHGEIKIYPVLASILPTWFQAIPNTNVYKSGGNEAIVCVDKTALTTVITGIDVTGLAVGADCNGTAGQVALYSTVTGNPTQGATEAAPVKTRDVAMVAEYVRDNGSSIGGGLGDGVCAPDSVAPISATGMACMGGVNANADCMDRTDCTKFDIRLNGGNTFPLFDGFQLADGLEMDTKAEVDAMLYAFQNKLGGSDAKHTKFLNLIETDFDLTHGIVPAEWALGGSKRGGCVSCHSSKDPASPNYNVNSVGFFEGYVQPVDKAGFMVGGYDLIKNWTAMFADFDCTAFCGMGQQNDAAFFNPMTGEIMTGATCTAGSMFATIDQCVGMMTQTFDVAMGFPNGTAMQMGMYDGIAGLQGFTVNTLQTMGFLGCNPFGGPLSGNSPAGSVNACMPAPTLSPGFDSYGLNAGVCNGETATTPGACAGGFRNSGACMNDADCKGAMTNADEIAHNPMGLILSRKEVRSRQKIDLQQGYPGNVPDAAKNNIRWAMSITKNPGNAAHVNSWDQASYCIDRNPALYPNPFKPGAIACTSIPYTQTECTDGLGLDGTWMGTFCSSAQSPDGQRHIMNMVTANQFLGYTSTKLAELMVPMGGVGGARSVIHIEHQTYDCSTCHSDGNGGTNATYSVVPAFVAPNPEAFIPNLNAAGEVATCTSQCHLAASAPVPSDKAKARVSATTDMVTNFKVNLDGSASTCYHVDVATGQVTQGTNTYTWTFDAVAPSVAPVSNTCGNVATCAATWAAAGTNNVTLAVSCDQGGTTDSATVAATGINNGSVANANPTLAYSVAAGTKNLTLTAAGLDGEVIGGTVQILWGVNEGRSDLTDAAAITAFKATGVAHTYAKAGTYTITVGTKNDGTPNNKVYTYTLDVVVP